MRQPNSALLTVVVGFFVVSCGSSEPNSVASTGGAMSTGGATAARGTGGATGSAKASSSTSGQGGSSASSKNGGNGGTSASQQDGTSSSGGSKPNGGEATSEASGGSDAGDTTNSGASKGGSSSKSDNASQSKGGSTSSSKSGSASSSKGGSTSKGGSSDATGGASKGGSANGGASVTGDGGASKGGSQGEGGAATKGGSSSSSAAGGSTTGSSATGGKATGGAATGGAATGGAPCATPFKFKTPFMDGKIFTADPSAHVFNGKVYVYPSHDLANNPAENADADHFNMSDFHVYSTDLACWPVTDHGEILNIKDVPWASKQMWAPDAAFKNDKYYFYFPVRDKSNNFRIGVATSGTPTGPFKAEPQPIAGSSSIDPCVFMDDDGSAYMYFGGKEAGQLPASASGPRVAKMSDDMLSFSGSVSDLKIEGNSAYYEAPWVHKYKGTYYLSYSTGPTHLLVWATGTSPLGPFTYKGQLLSPPQGWTTHHSIIEYNGKWYLFYADSTCSGGTTQRRCVKVQEFTYTSNGGLPSLSP